MKADRILVVVEGRDGAGKTTLATAITHQSRLEPITGIATTRVVKLPTPTEAELRGAYFNRFVHHLPRAGELMLFDRSWYSRAGVERVMGFCSAAEVERFFDEVGPFEERLRARGVALVKLYLEVTRDEQARRLATRAAPTEIDLAAMARADDYDRAEAEMLARTSTSLAPWHVLSTNRPEEETADGARAIICAVQRDGEGEER